MKRKDRYQPHLVKKQKEGFWDNEYKDADNLAISSNPSEDLMKFTRYVERDHGRLFFNPLSSVADLGCGNGRNLIYLSQTYGMRGFGCDISAEAIAQAKKRSTDLPLSYAVQSIADPVPLPDESQVLVLDMMTSHFLNETQRIEFKNEIARILKPGGWLFFKTFLLDEDKHAKRLLTDFPAAEAGSYIHPKIGVAEHVFTEEEIVDILSDKFLIHKIHKSHGHLRTNGAAKRRSISVYAQKIS
ncbi:MAG: hypothetical protein RL094_702 [Candidatus Parcubacteria bacterium]|jgi:SAM-dependent methyltransferase